MESSFKGMLGGADSSAAIHPEVCRQEGQEGDAGKNGPRKHSPRMLEVEQLIPIKAARGAGPKQARIRKDQIYNSIKFMAGEDAKTWVERKIERTVYYQYPEVYGIKKEPSQAFEVIFLNWRKAIASLFSRFREVCLRNARAPGASRGAGFYVYADKALYFFHSREYKGCARACCAGEEGGVYHLRVFSPRREEAFEAGLRREEIEYRRKEGAFYISGHSVLYLFDGILNLQASPLGALPMVLSRRPFLYGILTKPSVSVRSASANNGVLEYYMEIEGWHMGKDFARLNSRASVVDCSIR